MQVQNIECQIARAQLGRYLAGDGMAGEAVSQLEAHIAKCPDCKAAMQAKRASLEAALTTSTPKSHPAHSAKPSRTTGLNPSASRLAQALMAKAAAVEIAPPTPPKVAPTAAAAPAPAAKPVAWKPIVYSGALAIVLIGMSYLSKNDLLGTKAGTGLPEKAPVTSAAPKATPSPAPVATPSPAPNPSAAPVAKTKVVATPVATKPVETEKPVTKPVEAVKPAIKPIVTPKTPVKPHVVATTKLAAKPTVHKAAAVIPKPAVHRAKAVHKVVHRAVRHALVVRPRRRVTVRRTHLPASHHGIRIYDPSGNPIK
jgi:hypothetical protein